MKIALLSLGIFVSSICHSQDVTYKRYVDSTIVRDGHEKEKEFKAKRDGLKINYRYSKLKKQLKLITVTEKTNPNWTFYYHFIDGKLVQVYKWDGVSKFIVENIGSNSNPIFKPITKFALYYIKESVLVYTEESNTQIENIDFHIKRAEDLRSKAPLYH